MNSEEKQNSMTFIITFPFEQRKKTKN